MNRKSIIGHLFKESQVGFLKNPWCEPGSNTSEKRAGENSVKA
jgi:hypothetical protein